MGAYKPGQQFIIRLLSLDSGSAVLTQAFGANDLEIISGAYLSLTTATSTTSVADTKLGTVNQYMGRVIEFTSNANATSLPNVGVRRVITGTTLSTSTMTFNALPATPQVGDKYKILTPVPRGCSRVALASVSERPPASVIVPIIYTVSNAAGNRWGGSLQNTATSPLWLSETYSVPIEFALGGGDITVAVTLATGAWVVANDFFLHFTAS